jgi:hypothetical protein
MKRIHVVLVGLGRFVWDFLVGDDWRMAAAIAVVLVVGALAAAGAAVPESVLAPGLGAAIIAVTLGTLLIGSLSERRR